MDKAHGRGIYRAIYTNLWDDPDFHLLPSNAKFVFVNLRTSPLSNMPCIFPFYLDAVEKHTGLTKRAIKSALKILSERDWIKIQDGMVWIRNGLKYDPNISLKNPKHMEALKKTLAGLPKSDLVREFCAHYRIDLPFDIPNREGMAYPMLITEPDTETDPDTEPEPDQEREKDWVPSELSLTLMALYNQLCPKLPRVETITRTREANINKAFKEMPDLEWWKRVFSIANHVRIEDDTFWQPNFDWLTKDVTNAIRMSEGAFGDYWDDA